MHVLERLLTVVAPFSCLVCQDEGKIICDPCRFDAFPAPPSRCYRCYAASADSRVCKNCRSRSPLAYVWVATDYKNTAKELLWQLKFNRAQEAAKAIAASLHDSLPYFHEETVVSHVPTASSRIRQRGYDHSKLIAKELARLRELPYQAVLARSGQGRQVGAKRDVRLKQLAEVFRPYKVGGLEGKTVILVDDVVTSGATIETAARVLKTADFKQINAVLFAQKQ